MKRSTTRDASQCAKIDVIERCLEHGANFPYLYPYAVERLVALGDAHESFE